MCSFRRFAVLAFLLGVAATAQAAISFDSTAGHNACKNVTTAATSTTLTVTLVAGDTAFVVVGFPNNTTTVSSITDNATGSSSVYGSQAVLRNTNSTTTGGELWATPIGGVGSGVTTLTINVSASVRFSVCAWEYSGALAYGVVATAASGSSASPSISLTTQDSNNFIVSAMVHAASTSGWTASVGNLRASIAGTSTDAGVAGMDNTVASAGSVTTTATITSAAWIAVAIELRSVASSAAVPVQLQHRGCPSGANNATTYAEYDCPLPNGTQSGNTVVVGLQYGVNASITPSVTDENSDVFTKDFCGITGDANQTVCIFHAVPTAGSHLFKASFSGANASFIDMVSAEFDNLNGVDTCQGGTAASGTTLAPTTNLTFLNAGELIFQIGENDSGTSGDVWTAGSGQLGLSWALLQNDQGYSSQVTQGAQWSIYALKASFEPKMTMSVSASWNTAACGFKTATAGSGAPAGIYITSLEHYNIVTATSGFKLGAPLTGNAAALGCVDAPGDGDIASISASGGETWTKVEEDTGVAAGTAQGGITMWWYTHNVTLSPSDVLTITTGTPSGSSSSSFVNADCLIYAVSGADTNPLDTSITAGANTTCTSGGCTSNGNQTTGNVTSLTTGTVTPSTANGVVLGLAGISNPQCTGLNSPGTTDTAYSPQEATQSEMDENNCKGHYYNPNTSSFTFTWVITNVPLATGQWNWAGMALKAPAAAPSCVPTLTLMGVGRCG